MILVDSGYLIALADQRDQLHKRAIAWSTSCTEPLLVTEYVLWETINALSNRAFRLRAHDIVQAVKTEAQFIYVPASRELHDIGIAAHREFEDKDWSLTDCISFYLMRERGSTRALAYDHHFEQAGFDALLRRDPS